MELASGSQRHDGSCNMISMGGTWEALSCDGRTLASHNILYVTCKIHTYHWEIGEQGRFWRDMYSRYVVQWYSFAYLTYSLGKFTINICQHFTTLSYILGLAHNDTLEFLPCEKYVEAFFTVWNFKCVIMGQNIDKVIKCLAYTQISHFVQGQYYQR
jgi:hypothetical protein